MNTKNHKALLSILLVCAAFISNAQVFVNVSATGSNDGSTWENAFTDLQPALDATSLGDEVWMAAGTYTVPGDTMGISFEFPHDLKLYGGFAGTETSLDQRDFETNLPIISGDLNVSIETDLS